MNLTSQLLAKLERATDEIRAGRPLYQFLRNLAQALDSPKPILRFNTLAELGAYNSLNDVDGQIAYVASVDDYFSLLKAGGLGTNNITVVDATPPDGAQWQRRLVASQKWLTQDLWTVDAVNGNDENDGNPAPIKTFKELQRRIGAQAGQIRQNTVVTVAAGPDNDENFTLDVETTNTATFLRVTGVRTTLYSGTFTAPYQAADPLTNLPDVVTDGALAVDWATVGAVTGLTLATAYNTGRLLEITSSAIPANRGAVAFAAKQSPNAIANVRELATSPWVAYGPDYTPGFESQITPALGDGYTIHNIPVLSGVHEIGCRNRPVVVENLKIARAAPGLGFTPQSAFFYYACEVVGATVFGANILTPLCSNSSFIACKLNFTSGPALFADWELSGCLLTGPAAIGVFAGGRLVFTDVSSSCQGNGVAGFAPVVSGGLVSTTTGNHYLRAINGGVIDVILPLGLWDVNTALLARAGSNVLLRSRLYGTLNPNNSNGLKIDAGATVEYSGVTTDQPLFSPTPGSFAAFASTTVCHINIENLPMAGGLSFPSPLVPLFTGRQTGTVTLAGGSAVVSASVASGSKFKTQRTDIGAGVTGTSLNVPTASRVNNTAANTLGSFTILDETTVPGAVATSASTVEWTVEDARSGALVPRKSF